MDHDVREVGFYSRVDPALPVEVVGYRALVDRMGAAHFAATQRPTFGLMLVVGDGRGSHTVDFERIDLSARRIVFVRPGQVQQWHVANDLEATAVLARPELCRVDGWFPGQASYRDVDQESMTTAVHLSDALKREQERFVADVVSVRLMSDLFSALLGLFQRSPPCQRPSVLPEAYVAFRAAVESGLGQSRDARPYIAELGFSERTVARACRQVTGLSAKGVLDKRIMLEAKRLLAHTDRPVGQIGATLGFSEASNFNKFFVRHSGGLPAAFRAELRSSGFAAGDQR